MKQIICLLMLCAAISQVTFAQNKTNTEKTFELSDDFAHRKFLIDLGKGNKMQIELTEIEDLSYVLNVDSLLRVFIADITPFKDSLSDELTSKRIDYRIDTSGVKKMRIQQFAPKGLSYAITGGEPAALKLEQDTVNFSGTVYFVADYTLRKPFNASRNYRLSFFVNDVNDLQDFIGTGLNEKLKVLRKNYGGRWSFISQNNYKLNADPEITANHPHGFAAGDDFLQGTASVNVQNYKAYFVPSFTLSLGLIISSHGFYKREFHVGWEPHFFFDRTAEGKLRTYRNDFLSLTLSQGLIRDKDPRKTAQFETIVNLGYLIHRSGEYFEENTWRFGAGRLSLFEGKTKIAPVIYFNNFFKGVTPGLRWIQRF